MCNKKALNAKLNRENFKNTYRFFSPRFIRKPWITQFIFQISSVFTFRNIQVCLEIDFIFRKPYFFLVFRKTINPSQRKTGKPYSFFSLVKHIFHKYLGFWRQTKTQLRISFQQYQKITFHMIINNYLRLSPSIPIFQNILLKTFIFFKFTLKIQFF